jgi:hypothetical protein
MRPGESQPEIGCYCTSSAKTLNTPPQNLPTPQRQNENRTPWSHTREDDLHATNDAASMQARAATAAIREGV